MKKILLIMLGLMTIFFAQEVRAATLDDANAGDAPSATVVMTDEYGHQVTPNAAGEYTTPYLTVTETINNPTAGELKFNYRVMSYVRSAIMSHEVAFINNAGEDIARLIGNPGANYGEPNGQTTVVNGLTYNKATKVDQINPIVLPAHKQMKIRVFYAATSTSVLAAPIKNYLIGSGIATISTMWKPQVEMVQDFNKLIPVTLYEGDKQVNAGTVKLSAHLLPGTTNRIKNGTYNGADVYSFEGVYKLDLTGLYDANAIPGQYKIASKVPDNLYVLVKQTAAGEGMAYYGSVAQQVPISTDNAIGSSLLENVPTYTTTIDDTGETINTPNGALTLYKYGFNESNYDSDVQGALKNTGSGLATFAPLQIQVDRAVTGNFLYVDTDTGKQVGTQYFGNKNEGDSVDNNDLIPPDKFILTDKKTPYTYTDGDIVVKVTRYTDETYANLNASGEGQTAQLVTSQNKGLMARGLTIVNVPSYTGSGETGAPNINLRPDGRVTYTNMFDSSFKLVMAASKMTAQKTRVKELPIQSMLISGSTTQPVDIYANEGDNADGLTADYGQVVATAHGKSGDIPLGDIKTVMFSNGDATTYTGTITYSAIQDDLIDSAN